MPQNTHLELISAEAERLAEPRTHAEPDAEALRTNALELSHGLAWLPNLRSSDAFVERYQSLTDVARPLFAALEPASPEQEVSEDFRWLTDNGRLFQTALDSLSDAVKSLREVPHVRTADGATTLRVVALAHGCLAAASFQFSEKAFGSYVEAFQESTPLRMTELWALVPALKLVLLEEIVARAPKVLKDPAGTFGLGACIRSLRDVGQTSWKEVLEPLILIDRVLREDPVGAYSRMDFESRDLYRDSVVNISRHSDCTEMDVALEAVALARKAQQQTHSDPRVTMRRSHVGYYLLAEGSSELHRRVGFRASFAQRVQSFMREHPAESYLFGIEVLTFSIVLAIGLPLVGPDSSLGLIVLAMLCLLLPSSQSAVQLMNNLTTALLKAQILPKLDFSDGIPDDCLTLVAIPSLLLEEKQIRKLAVDLEVRFLGNHDPNIYFALVTDLPDTAEPAREDDSRVDLCSELIRCLNEKYAGRGMGSFLLLHRHRTYNPRERVWMGWERKRGKLLDLNKVLRDQYDSFPVKTGDLSILPRVRFVITLDSDTDLPRGSAERMIGAMAHPLNQAIIDPEKNIVVAGYGILQPRVGVSVQSAAHSRLANIYSGETGFDIYSRAVSDVYQDLYGEGSFAGKGICEVDTLHQVLDRRFPRNILLSHDLIEGAYARAGLASDIEIIEDYPSHYSAYNRRKHRWLRGDWQIAGWLFSRVLDESGHLVRNPISVISQWKILDNLRRSLVEPATFLLLLLGWLALPGNAGFWTLATLAILFVPAWWQFAFSLVKAVAARSAIEAHDAVDGLFAANVNVFFTLTFLAHQTLVSLDAVVRVLVRRMVTGQRLLEWETAAEAEIGSGRRNPVDMYLNWMPLFALALGGLVWFVRRSAFFTALPILILWACSKLVSMWLNRPSRPARKPASEKDQQFLRLTALRTWRYFAEFSTEEHNWLIPDNLQEEPLSIAARVSPTNIGFLVNARQVACEFGYLTIPEFVEQVQRTLATLEKLPRYHGHFTNWYDTRTLAPLRPLFVSSVDSGNLVASLWTLQQGCLEWLHRPLLQPSALQGFLDHLRLLVNSGVCPRKRLSAIRRETQKEWLQSLLKLPDAAFDEIDRGLAKSKHGADTSWFVQQARARVKGLEQTVRIYMPWLLPEFSSLRDDPAINLQRGADDSVLEQLPALIDALTARLQSAGNSAKPADWKLLCRRLEELLPPARANVVSLMNGLRAIANHAGRLANEMDFQFLLEPHRKMLSVGYDAESEELHRACYDLLATESRTAVFAAIAKEDISQECWFLLGRAHTVDHGRPVLLSWTGTMFEYLMPSLWMHTYPNTLLGRSRSGAVVSQQAYAVAKGIPWGISESAYSKRDDAGIYQYHAFGVPHLALRKNQLNALVVSPYSSFLALTVDGPSALRNLRKMARDGWSGPYGFYESADFSAARLSWPHRYELVHCWMAHHQGMSLLSIANFLNNDVVQRWFHSEPRVQATELLLQEKPVAHIRADRAKSGNEAA